MSKRKKKGDSIICQQCGVSFPFVHNMRQTVKFCGRDCFKQFKLSPNSPYPKIWWKPPNSEKAVREYLHRIIWKQNHPDETLEPDDLVHHIDHNPFNRDPSNLEKLSGENARAHHLEKHNYFRKKGTAQLVDDPDCPF